MPRNVVPWLQRKWLINSTREVRLMRTRRYRTKPIIGEMTISDFRLVGNKVLQTEWPEAENACRRTGSRHSETQVYLLHKNGNARRQTRSRRAVAWVSGVEWICAESGIYEPIQDKNEQARKRLKKLAKEHNRWVYRWFLRELKWDGSAVNYKRMPRFYGEHHLMLWSYDAVKWPLKTSWNHRHK